MSRFLPAPVKGVLAVLCIVLNTLWLFPILMVFAVIKLLVPTPSVRKGCTIVLNRIAWFWIGFNNVLADVLHNIEWDVRGSGYPCWAWPGGRWTSPSCSATPRSR